MSNITFITSLEPNSTAICLTKDSGQTEVSNQLMSPVHFVYIFIQSLLSIVKATMVDIIVYVSKLIYCSRSKILETV